MYPAPRNSIARFLCDVPDGSVLDKKALDKAISQLPVPLPGPGPPGISIQDAIKVRTPQPALYPTISHTISYIILYIHIVYDIVHDIVHDI